MYTKSNMSSPIELILANLAVGFGRAVVIEAATKFCGQKKVKKERKPRGQTSWNKMVDEVLEDMRKTNPETTHRMAFEEAGKRKRAGNPDAQAKYEERRAAKEVKRAAKATQSDVKTPAPAAALPPVATQVLEDARELERKKVFNFLFGLQEQGTVNMAASAPNLVRAFKFTQKKSDDYVNEYTNTYDALREKYAVLPVAVTPDRPTSAVAPDAPKKRGRPAKLPASDAE